MEAPELKPCPCCGGKPNTRAPDPNLEALQALERVRREARKEGAQAALDELRTLHKSMAHFLRVETWEGYKQGVTDAENAILALIAEEKESNNA